ncbi:Sensor histidine kinase YehU [compost metagenome]
MIHLILQPLLENALEHGIDRLRKNTRRGRVALTGHMTEEGLLQFSIEDNGPGMDTETVQQLLAPHARGYGLKNVHDRIQILFGNVYGLQIESVPEQGTRVIVTFPKFLGDSSGTDVSP